MEFSGSTLGSHRIQIFLDPHPEKSGYANTYSLLIGIFNRTRRFKAIAACHLTEVAGVLDVGVQKNLDLTLGPIGIFLK
jgi:hypothetical protein